MNTELTTALNGKIKIWQPIEGYRFAIDSILMAAFVPNKCKNILELGIGVGAASLALAYRLPEAHITGIDIQETNIELAKKNVQKNAFFDRFLIVLDDFRNRNLPGNHFDCVMMNPPFHEEDNYLPSPSSHKTTSHGELKTTLKHWMDEAYRCLKSHGHIVIIHKSDRLDDLLTFLHVKYGHIEVFPLWPKEGRAAKRVLIRAQKASKSAAKLYHGLIIHHPNGEYTSEAKKILEGGLGIITINEMVP